MDLSPQHVVDPHVRPHWLPHFARLGYLAIGLVYTLVGTLAVLSLLGLGGRVTGSTGATKALLDQPYGKVLLGVIVLGLAIYVVWRFVQAFMDVDGRGAGAVGVARRCGLALSGLFYAFVAVVAAERLFANLGAVPDSQETLVAALMRTGWGTVVVGALGVAVVGVGLYQFYGAYGAGYMSYLRDEAYGGVTGPALSALGRFGLAARGGVFLLIGGFLVVAAWQNDPSETRSLAGALRTLREQPYGDVLFGVVAAGLIAFGLTMLGKVRYRAVGEAEEDD